MNLCLAYFKGYANLAGLQRLSQQEGFALREVDTSSRFEYFSSLIVDGILSTQQRDYVLRYLKSGGGVILCGEAVRQFGISVHRREIDYLLPDPGSMFGGAGLVDIGCTCAIPTTATMLPDQRGRNTVFAGNHGGGYVVTLPFSIGLFFEELLGKAKTKSFYAKRSRLPFELIASGGYSGIRRVFAASLEYLHSARKIPYVHEWYYPDAARSFAVFRIDTDYAEAPAIEDLYNLLNRRNIPGSWFVDVKSQESILDRFKLMKGQEIGLHCYDHETYPDFERNKKNLSRGLDILRSAGFIGHGFVAPFGKWNVHLDRVIGQLGFTYSSEFSYDYDNLPSFVSLNESANLQIPVHPISIGSLKRQGFSQDEMIGYFERVAREKFAAREPLFFYHHPNDGNLSVLERLFDLIEQLKIPYGTMQDFCDWWLLREQGQVPVQKEYHSYDRNELSMGEGFVERVRYRVVTGEGESFVAGRGNYSMSELQWEKPPLPEPLPPDITRVRRFNPWVPLIRLQNRIFK